MTTKEYAQEFGMSVGEWAKFVSLTPRQLQKLTKDNTEKFKHLLLITTLKKYNISDYKDLVKILETYKLQKELFNK